MLSTAGMMDLDDLRDSGWFCGIVATQVTTVAKLYFTTMCMSGSGPARRVRRGVQTPLWLLKKIVLLACLAERSYTKILLSHEWKIYIF